jgi:hypothetical protein
MSNVRPHVTHSYSWRCLACNSTNAFDLRKCAVCDCPSNATLRDIEAHQPKPSDHELDRVRHQITKHRVLQREAQRRSHFRTFYFLSVGAYLLSLLLPDGLGLYTLVMGYISVAMGISAAWLANPLLLVAFLLARAGNDPWRWRWLVYGALALMLITPTDLLQTLPIWNQIFCLLWVLSALILAVGLHWYRWTLRALSREAEAPNPSVERTSPGKPGAASHVKR